MAKFISGKKWLLHVDALQIGDTSKMSSIHFIKQQYKQIVNTIANENLHVPHIAWWGGSRVVPASAGRCVRPLLGGEGAGEGEPTSMHRSPAREVEEAVEDNGMEKRVRDGSEEGKGKNKLKTEKDS